MEIQSVVKEDISVKLVDPVDRTVDRDISLVKDLSLKLIYAINTHVHADHVTGTGLIKSKVPGVKSIIAKASNAMADLFVEHGDKIHFGGLFLEVLQIVKKSENLKKISFLARSLGGLFARHAVSVLYSPNAYRSDQSDDTEVSTVGNSVTRGTIAGLEPINFITLATPHLGMRVNVEKLARKGYRVLVVEQTETPEQLKLRKENGSKDKVVKREICAPKEH